MTKKPMFLNDKSKILEILSYATRAPSTHNSQPWLFKLLDNKIEVYYDPKLFLPEADQESRDMYISIGCMLENLSLAAEHFGFFAEITFDIDDQTHRIGGVVLKEKVSQAIYKDDSLFQTIPSRVNARGVFEQKLVSGKVKEALMSESKPSANSNIIMALIDDKEKIQSIAQLTEKSMHLAYSKTTFRKEMSHWMNSNLSNKKQGLPGYSLNMPLLVSLIIPVLIRFFNIGSLLGKLNFKSLSSAPLIAVIASPNTKLSWISVGMYAERLMLRAQSLDLQTSIYVGSIEMGALYKEVQKVTQLEERPQFLFAIGKIKGNHKITPRHPIEKKIIS